MRPEVEVEEGMCFMERTVAFNLEDAEAKKLIDCIIWMTPGARRTSKPDTRRK